MADVQCGALLRGTRVAPHRGTVAIDERPGRLFVASTGPIDPRRADRPVKPGSVRVIDQSSAI